MKKINQIALVTSIVILCLIVGNIILLLNIKSSLNVLVLPPDWLSLIVAAIIILIAVGHLFNLSVFVMQFRKFRDENFLRSIAFALGIFSLFLVAVNVPMLSDIGKEYMFHQDIEEWKFLFTNHGIHALFALISIIECVVANKRISKMSSIPDALMDESTFLTVHQVGVFSAICGFISESFLIGSGISNTYLTGLLFSFSIVLSLPYGLAVLYWLFQKRKEKPADWTDEKQFLDISRGALVTLTISTTMVIVLYLLIVISKVDFNSMLFFPAYLFLIELCFSGSTLYFSKRL